MEILEASFDLTVLSSHLWKLSVVDRYTLAAPLSVRELFVDLFFQLFDQLLRLASFASTIERVFFDKEDYMSVRAILLLEDRVYTDLVTVDIAEDLAAFVAELSKILCVGFEELMNPCFVAHRVRREISERRVASDYSLIGNKTFFEERLSAELFIKFFISPETGLRIDSTVT